MKIAIKKITVLLMIVLFGTVANATLKGERIRLKNGQATSTITLNPSRTYKFTINGKEFKNLKIALQTSSKNIHVKIQSPKSKTLTSGVRKNFAIKNVGAGDYQIILKNTGSKDAVITVKSWSTSGD